MIYKLVTKFIHAVLLFSRQTYERLGHLGFLERGESQKRGVCTFLRYNYGHKISDVLCDLVPFAQSKKRENHPWTSVTFSKVAGFQSATLLKLTLLHGCFSLFKIVQMVPNRATHHIILSIILSFPFTTNETKHCYY